MVVEAQWDRPNVASARAGHRRASRRRYDGSTIMASMGSLGHYMQEASRTASASAISCTKATATSGWPRSTARGRTCGWMLIEEKAEGGDMLAARARANPEFLDGFRQVAEGGGLALYQRN